MSFLGAGIGYRRKHRDALLAPSGDHPAVLEIIPGHFFADPAALAPIAARYPVVFHEVGLSLGTAGPPSAVSRALIARIRALSDIARPAVLSDHVAITRSPGGIDLGHLCPLWYTRETLGWSPIACARCRITSACRSRSRTSPHRRIPRAPVARAGRRTSLIALLDGRLRSMCSRRVSQPIRRSFGPRFSTRTRRSGTWTKNPRVGGSTPSLGTTIWLLSKCYASTFRWWR